MLPATLIPPPARVAPRTTFLMHCNGTDGSTTFVEEMAGLTVSVSGNAQIDTAQSKFGGASALFDGSGDGLSVALAAGIDFDNEFIFTIECWVRVDAAVSGNGSILIGITGTGFYPYQFWYDHSTTKLGVRGFLNNSGSYGSWQSSAISTGQWYHMALSRCGQTLRAFVDGVEIGSAGNNNLPLFSTDALWIGMFSGGQAPLKGWIDDIRFRKGYAYTTSFTPPAAEFSDHA